MKKTDLEKQIYLGDGVYVGHDGYHIVLWLDDVGGYGPNAIALEPEVFETLMYYKESIFNKRNMGVIE